MGADPRAEPDDDGMGKPSEEPGWKCFSWNCQAGIHEITEVNEPGFSKDMPDPLDAVGFLTTINQKSILFIENLHRFLKGDGAIDIIQRIYNLVDQYKASLKSLVVLAPSVEIPVELSKVFTALSFDLPGREDLKKMLIYMADSTKKPLPSEEKQESLLEAGKGLSAFEFENALALSLVTKKQFDPLVIMEQKSQLIKKNASLVLENFSESLETLKGYDNLKNFALRVITSEYARGVLLVGVPGCGKSHFGKGIGKAVGWLTPQLDFGRLFAGEVGASEHLAREAFQCVDAFSPCVLLIDEIEKGLSGIESSGKTDGGTGSRVFGTFLNWLNDHKSRVFVVATCNNISAMPPEFLRAERWDAIFFVDLPTERERRTILDLYKNQYHVEGEPSHNLEGWSGAEIKSLCRIAAMMKCSLAESERYVIPLSQSMADKIEGLREWARTRTIPATLEAREAKPTGRRVE